ncbi:hypothetical protein M9458_014429, partial [Cirrhinus mrigala]
CGFVLAHLVSDRFSADDRLAPTTSIECQFTNVMRMDYMVYFNFFVWVVAPLIIMTGLYAEIFRVISRQLNRRAEATSDSSKYYRKELKLANLLAAAAHYELYCVFLPDMQSIFMSHINSALNPLVYAFRIQRFRDTLIQIAQRFVLCKTTSAVPGQRGPGPITEKTQIQ